MAKLSEATEFQIPLRNLFGMLVFAAMATWAYFGVIERSGMLEHNYSMVNKETSLNSDFRTRWPRGELGALPDDSRQFMLIESLEKEVRKLDSVIHEGKAPFDRQQQLTLDFFERRLSALESNSHKMKVEITNGPPTAK